MKYIILLLAMTAGTFTYFKSEMTETPAIAKKQNEEDNTASKFVSSNHILEENCHKCHNPEKKKGKFDLAELGNVVNAQNLDRWNDAMDQVITEEMPPKEELSDEDRDALVKWFKSKINSYVNNSVAKVAPETRRMTLKEYENSLQDVLGIKNLGTNSPLNEITEDAYTHGFNNISKDLIMSAFHLNGYINTARNVLDEVILDFKKPKKETFTLKPMDVIDPPKNSTKYLKTKEYHDIISHQQVLEYKNFPEFKETGYYKITFKAAGIDREYPYREEDIGVHKCDPITLGVHIGTHQINKPLPDNIPEEIVIEEWVSKGSSLHFTYVTDGLRMSGNGNFKFNSSLTEKKGIDKKAARSWQYWRGPRARIYTVKVDGPYYKSWPPQREQALIGNEPKADELEPTLKQFAERAYRRPLNPNEIDGILVYSKNLVPELGIKKALKEGMVAILSSASFLFLERGKSYSNYDLASKLSYTLWSSRPDDKLMELAGKNDLDNGAIIREQVQRMISNDKNQAFVKNFSNAWFELNMLGFMPPEPTQFFYWNRKSVGHDMKNEVLAFMDHGLKNNIPITEFFSADYSFVNQDLAKIYGIDGIKGEKLRKYTFKDGRRGGILGTGGFLVLTSDGVSTNPIHRGVWIKRNILGSEPSPPPPDIMVEEPDVRKARTIREVLALHNTDENCKSCHAKIDPWGWAFENFDPAGQWRDDYMLYKRDSKGNGSKKNNSTPIAKVDASSTLSNGDSYKNIHSFKKILLERDEEIVRCFVEKFITYMNGAKPDVHMNAEIEKIVEKSKSSNYKIVDTIVHIFQSPVAYSNRQVVTK
ncbi:MAG: DUF1592 domain-containing protein [Lentisphaeraceae bacterium]|nr:DUF1592 domain-containing protein [Lentisphaeraceae bacterium]